MPERGLSSQALPLGEVVSFVKLVPGQQPETLALLWNGVDALVIAGPSGTHLGGHAERNLAYRDAKLDWVRSLGYISVAEAKHQGVLSAGPLRSCRAAIAGW